MAHKNQEQLELLINNLIGDFDLYIHIDTKSTIDKDELVAKYPDVKFYSQYNIIWSGYNQILCPHFLFSEAYKNKYRFYILISAQDLPLISNEAIKRRLKEEDISYVVSDKLPLPQWKFNGGFDRVQLFWESDIVGNRVLDRLKRKVICNIKKNQRKYNLRRPLYKDLEYYGGSTWFILRHDAVEHLLYFTERNPKYLKTFKYSFCADELWLQTILATSDCETKNEHITYLDWGKGPEHPRTLRIDDYDTIINSSHFFARKFDLEVDKEVVHKILERRNSIT
ncbi:beta-1,6-N-acetylglucosaminyltransferase [Dysgonomonas alginatilytica]|nr:beta-1,6-N-acetylglucosaminyltransferase [Dysgonomonas alginatilytica]